MILAKDLSKFSLGCMKEMTPSIALPNNILLHTPSGPCMGQVSDDIYVSYGDC